jgi:hypothetical protein
MQARPMRHSPHRRAARFYSRLAEAMQPEMQVTGIRSATASSDGGALRCVKNGEPLQTRIRLGTAAPRHTRVAQYDDSNSYAGSLPYRARSHARSSRSVWNRRNGFLQASHCILFPSNRQCCGCMNVLAMRTRPCRHRRELLFSASAGIHVT